MFRTWLGNTSKRADDIHGQFHHQVYVLYRIPIIYFAFTHPGGWPMPHGSIGRPFVLGYHGNHRSAATAWVGVITECTKWIHSKILS